MNNTAVRSISAVVFGAIMLCGLLINEYLFAALIVFLVCTMMAEFFKMTMGESYKFSRILGIAAGVILFLLMFLFKRFGVPVKFVSLSMVPIFVVMCNSLFVRDRSEFLKFAFIYTGILYIAVPMALSTLVVFDSEGAFNGMLILSFFVIIWCSDIGAYVLGTALGQKYGSKICPEISPKKSWIGFWGGYIFAILATLILHWTGLLEIPFIHALILATLMHVAGVFGDFFESAWKRLCNLKDSGSIIPGHGGMLDRFDSALMAMPLGAMYLALAGLI